MAKLFTLLLSLFLVHTLTAQCLVQQQSLPDRIDQSDCVIEGRVLSQFCFVEKSSGRLLTANEWEVYAVFKGDPKTEKVTVFTLGGVLGDRMETATPSLQFHIGQVGTVMLSDYATLNVSSPDHLAKVAGFWGVAGPASAINYDMATGRAVDAFETFPTLKDVRADLEELIGQKAAVKYHYSTPVLMSNKKAGISSFSPTTVTAGTLSKLTITGTGFGTSQGTVYFANPDDGGNTLLGYADSAHIQTWSDTKVEILVPGRAGSGKIRVETAGQTQYASTSDLTVTYSCMNISQNPPGGFSKKVYRTHFSDDNGDGGYTWTFNKDFSKMHPGAIKAVMRAMEKWRCATLINFSIDSTKSTSIDQVNTDGVHTIMWQNANQSINTGALGVCFNSWSACFDQKTKDWHWYLNSVDLVFDEQLASGFSWNFGTGDPGTKQYDFESVVLHELGHAHQLGHIINSAGIMHYSLKNGEKKRTLSTGSDIAGGNSVMSISGTTDCSSSQMVPHDKISSSVCKLLNLVDNVDPDFDASELTVCLGDSVTLTNTTDPKSSTINWVFPSGVNTVETKDGGNIRVVTFNAAGSYTLKLEATNGTATGSKTKTVVVEEKPVVVTNITNVNCFGETNGEVEFLLDVGATPYTVKWLFDDKEENPRKSLSSGVYSVVITDNNGCKVSETAFVDQPDELIISTFGTKAASGGGSNGKAWVSPAGGVRPYKYLWDDGNAQTTDTAFNVSSGNYMVEVTDKNGCTIDKTMTVDEINSLNEQEMIVIYPNPVTDWLHIASAGKIEQVFVYDSKGQLVQFSNLEANGQLNMSTLQSGHYTLKLVGSSIVSHRQLMKF